MHFHEQQCGTNTIEGQALPLVIVLVIYAATIVLHTVSQSHCNITTPPPYLQQLH